MDVYSGLIQTCYVCLTGFGDCQSFPCQLEGACIQLPASELSPYNLTYTCSCIPGVTGHICETSEGDVRYSIFEILQSTIH